MSGTAPGVSGSEKWSLLAPATLRESTTVRTPSAAVDETTVTWEKQVVSARGFKRVGRHSEHAI
jgi:hypothetical protein